MSSLPGRRYLNAKDFDDRQRTFPDFADEFAEIENETGGWIARLLSVELGLPPIFLHPTPFDGGTMHAVASSAGYILGAGGRAFDVVLEGLSEHPMDLPDGDPLLDDAE